MSAISFAQAATWAIAGAATGCVLIRPWRLPEATWAVLGALCLVLFALLPWHEALLAIGKGTDVYLFLVGMMLLSELARHYGVFDWLAALAARRARGSARRLFALIFAVGILVTALLSNDATAVVLTPAVFAAARTSNAEPLPYLFLCAFVANAASFVLPISNPANLVVFGTSLPPLQSWLARFALPSVAAIAATYLVLRWTQRVPLSREIATDVAVPTLTRAGRWTIWGILLSALALLSASALNLRLGLPTLAVAVLTALAVLLHERQRPWGLLRDVSWSVIPLVAGLFVLVEGLIHTGVIERLAGVVTAGAAVAPTSTSWSAGLLVALACNLLNNLPVGLIAHSVLASGAQVPQQVASSLLVAVDLGPNISVTGSLATLLWLVALRREGQHIGAWDFLRVGALVTLPALVLALAAVTSAAATLPAAAVTAAAVTAPR
ncbi:MAG TPA: SLC13 family permease [Steroidobacteraceae bacterium]|nr:SLC13 family permease [Steroidobacteraceae bacterium]